MKIIGKREEFLDWLEKIAVGKIFETAVVKVTRDGILSSNSNTENVVYRYLKYNKLTTVVDAKESGVIKFQVNKLYQTIDKLFNDDDKITLETVKKNGDEILRVSSKETTRTQPLFSIEPDEMEDVDTIKFKVENNIPYLNKGQTKVGNKVKVGTVFLRKMTDVTQLQDIISRWRFTIKDGKFIVEVGDVINKRDVVKLVPSKVIVNAEHNVVNDFGLQLKDIAKVFRTNVDIFLENNMPVIFHEYTMNYDLWIMLLNMSSEDIEEEAKIEQEVAIAEGDTEKSMIEKEQTEQAEQEEIEYEMGDM